MPTPLERVIPVARRLLVLPLEDGRHDLWLWEHSERVMRLADLVAQLSDVSRHQPDRLAVCIAGLFHDIGWMEQTRQGPVERWQILARPTSDMQRELAAARLVAEVESLLPADVVRRAADAIRNCNRRDAAQIEARILAEAENLDEVGVMYMLRQFRQHQAEGRPIEQMLTAWARQKEYKYWELRVRENFRFESTRELALQRVGEMDRIMKALAQSISGDDIRGVLGARSGSAVNSA